MKLLSSPITKETIRRLRKGMPMKTGPPGLTVKAEFFDRRRKNTEDLGSFILFIQNDSGQFGLAQLAIYRKQHSEDDFKIEAKSAVLWDIMIHQEEWRRKGIGSEWLGFMREFAKSEGVERFYAHNVQAESEGFFVKSGFVPLDNPDWWIIKEFWLYS